MMCDLKILMVDDERFILSALSRCILDEFDVEIVKTTSPLEALSLVEAREFDLMITDHRMPEMDGLELLEKVQALRPEMLNIMLTGYIHESLKNQVMALGVYGFITKPWDDEELYELLRGAFKEAAA